MERKIKKLRVFARKKGDFWVAFCLDLNLAVQASSAEEARKEIRLAVEEHLDYVNFLNQSGNHEAAMKMINRPAPASIWAKYYFLFALSKLHMCRPDMTCWLDSNQTVPA